MVRNAATKPRQEIANLDEALLRLWNEKKLQEVTPAAVAQAAQWQYGGLHSATGGDLHADRAIGRVRVCHDERVQPAWRLVEER